MKYKKGDEVTIIANESGHEFKIGEKVTITELFPEEDNPHYRADGKNDFWWIDHESDIASIDI